MRFREIGGQPVHANLLLLHRALVRVVELLDATKISFSAEWPRIVDGSGRVQILGGS